MWNLPLLGKGQPLYQKDLGVLTGRVAWPMLSGRPSTDTLWFETVTRQSRQQAELQAVWMVAMNEPSPVIICTDSWAAYQDLLFGFHLGKVNQWLIGRRPVWE